MKLSTLFLSLFYFVMFIFFMIQMKNCTQKVTNPSIFQKTTHYMVEELEVPAVTLCRLGPFRNNMSIAELFSEPCNMALDCYRNMSYTKYSDFVINISIMAGFLESSTKVDYDLQLYSQPTHTTLTCVTISVRNRVKPGRHSCLRCFSYVLKTQNCVTFAQVLLMLLD